MKPQRESFSTKFRHFLARHVPETIGFTPYYWGLRLLRLKLKRALGTGTPRVWARNSYVTGTMVPFISDLDLTVWFEQEPSAEDLSRLSHVLHRVSTLFPLQGEANVYSARDAAPCALLINRFELARDPELRERLGSVSAPAKSDKAEATAFLLRMLEGDIHNVLHYGRARQKKWDSHFSAVRGVSQRPLQGLWHDFPARSLLRAIVETAVQIAEPGDERDEAEAIRSLELYFECAGRGVPQHVLTQLLPHNPWWLVFLPHRFCFESPDRQDLTLLRRPTSRPVFQAQVSWELWGVLAQQRLLSDRVALRNHLRNLDNLVAASGTDSLSPSIPELLNTIGC